jgi:putative membrane protein
LTRAKIPMLLAASVLALGFAACSPENPASEATLSPEAPMDGATMETASADTGDIDFIEDATIANMFEVESAKLVLERSQVQAVKDFAQSMLDTHTASLEELKTLSASAMVTPPMALDNDHQGKLDALRNASVEDLDDVYIDQQTEVHETTLNAMKNYASNGKHAELQAFAMKTAPVVETHLTQVKALDESPADDITKSPSES